MSIAMAVLIQSGYALRVHECSAWCLLLFFPLLISRPIRDDVGAYLSLSHTKDFL